MKPLYYKDTVGVLRAASAAMAKAAEVLEKEPMDGAPPLARDTTFKWRLYDYLGSRGTELHLHDPTRVGAIAVCWELEGKNNEWGYSFFVEELGEVDPCTQ